MVSALRPAPPVPLAAHAAKRLPLLTFQAGPRKARRSSTVFAQGTPREPNLPRSAAAYPIRTAGRSLPAPKGWAAPGQQACAQAASALSSNVWIRAS